MEALDDYGSSSSCSSSDSSSAPVSAVVALSSPIERGTTIQTSAVRSQPHVNGNWAGHCYLRLPPCRQRLYSLSAAQQQVKNVVDRLERAGYSGTCQSHLSKNAALHLSLSRTFYLQAANLKPFVQALTKQLSAGAVTPFAVCLDTSGHPPVLLHNDERTRSFLVWPVLQSQQSPLVPLVQRINAGLALYQLPPYYDPPIFHVSLASFVPAISNEILCHSLFLRHSQSSTSSSLSSVSSEEEDHDEGAGGPQMVSEVHVTFGTTQHYTIPLTHPTCHT